MATRAQQTSPRPQAASTGEGVPLARLDEWDRHEVTSVAAKALVRLAVAWHLKSSEAAALAGVSARTWERMKAGGWSGRLNQDQVLRASALIGLYKALHLYFSDVLADEWVGLANQGPLFAGRRPIDVMIAGGLPAMIDTRDYVDALRGGV